MTELKSTGRQFDAPPVFETALTLQFEELDGFRTVHFGRFHQLIRERFPLAEDHPRADRIVEEFPRTLWPRWQVVPKQPGPERVWFRDRADGTLLLQVQPDRFSLNWRRATDGDEYPSFVANAERFLEEFASFVRFCAAEELGPVRTDLCELVYVNRILPEPDETLSECFERVLSGLDWSSSGSFLPVPEHATYNRVYLIDNNRGRLYVECTTLSPRRDAAMIQLKLTARVLCPPNSDPAEAIQLAHDWVVNGFVEVTDTEARRLRWKEKR